MSPRPDRLAAVQQALADLGVTVADLQHHSNSPTPTAEHPSHHLHQSGSLGLVEDRQAVMLRPMCHLFQAPEQVSSLIGERDQQPTAVRAIPFTRPAPNATPGDTRPVHGI